MQSRPSRTICFVFLYTLIICALSVHTSAQIASKASTASLVINAPKGTIIWADALRYGTISDNQQITIRNLTPGPHTVRARLKGRRELSQSVTLTSNSPGTLTLSFAHPAGAAELSFQTAEEFRESGKHSTAIDEYRRAIKSRNGSYPAARIGLARSLAASEEYEEAVAEARRALREPGANLAEAHTVIANTRRSQGLYEEAFASYRRALASARNFSPEAHTGLALTCEETGQSEEAIRQFRIAASQSNGTEPVIYFLLGSLLERQDRAKEAIEVYEKYLELEPQGKNVSATRSVLKQLKKEIQ